MYLSMRNANSLVRGATRPSRRQLRWESRKSAATTTAPSAAAALWPRSLNKNVAETTTLADPTARKPLLRASRPTMPRGPCTRRSRPCGRLTRRTSPLSTHSREPFPPRPHSLVCCVKEILSGSHKEVFVRRRVGFERVTWSAPQETLDYRQVMLSAEYPPQQQN